MELTTLVVVNTIVTRRDCSNLAFPKRKYRQTSHQRSKKKQVRRTPTHVEQSRINLTVSSYTRMNPDGMVSQQEGGGNRGTVLW
jgi:hypothetical protein